MAIPRFRHRRDRSTQFIVRSNPQCTSHEDLIRLAASILPEQAARRQFPRLAKVVTASSLRSLLLVSRI